MAIRVERNTLSLSAEASLCRRPRLWRRGDESARGGGGKKERSPSSYRPLSACCFFFLIFIFDQLSILSRVVNSIS